MHLAKLLIAAILGSLAPPLAAGSPAMAETDEIQVHTGEINEPGQFGVTPHDDYTPIGRTAPEFPGGVDPDHALDGVPEFA